MKFGVPTFYALEKGLKSKSKSVSRDCLVFATWLGYEVTKGTDDLRYAACEILLSTIEQYVHPGMELEERLLACLCIYYYTSGRGNGSFHNFDQVQHVVCGYIYKYKRGKKVSNSEISDI